MRELLIVFQEGFDEANITVMVNGKEVRRDVGVSTNPILGKPTKHPWSCRRKGRRWAWKSPTAA